MTGMTTPPKDTDIESYHIARRYIFIVICFILSFWLLIMVCNSVVLSMFGRPAKAIVTDVRTEKAGTKDVQIVHYRFELGGGKYEYSHTYAAGYGSFLSGGLRESLYLRPGEQFSIVYMPLWPSSNKPVFEISRIPFLVFWAIVALMAAFIQGWFHLQSRKS